MEEENTTFLSGNYATAFFNMTKEELEEEKQKRVKVHALFHLTSVNVFHSHLAKKGQVELAGK